MSPRVPNPWTDTENAALLAAAGDGSATITRDRWKEIAADLGTGRTWQAVKQQCMELRRASGFVRPPRTRATRKQIIRRGEADMQQPPDPGTLPQYTSITAAVFKDPLPGRSALDRRAQP